MIEEIWKPIKDYEGLYKIYANGDIISYPREIKYPSCLGNRKSHNNLKFKFA